ncbi:MAG: PD-(D/E)XK nuclease family protein, partial [Bacilli bacterium]
LQTDTSLEGILARIRTLVDKEMMTKEQTSLLTPDDLLVFVQSPLGVRMQRAEDIRREIPFIMTLTEERREQLRLTDIIVDDAVVQGICDCIFYEDNRWVLVDYKTDRVTNEMPDSELSERYRIQLLLYRDCLEAALGIHIEEMYLYYFTIHRAVAVSV